MIARAPITERDDRLRFGKHRGARIADLDDQYLYWLVRWAGLYDDTRAAIRDELRRRAPRRRSWRPVIRDIYGRQLLRVSGRGAYAVIQTCGIERCQLTVELYETAQQAQAHLADDCLYEGPGLNDCESSRHLAVNLSDFTVLRRAVELHESARCSDRHLVVEPEGRFSGQ